MIEDIVDTMSVPMAVTHFCSDVENTMRDNGDMDAASFCHAVRSWLKAEDESGISALHRIHMRIALRECLLDNVNFGRFPPPTMYIKGWPLQLWEALVASIDSKAILNSLAKRGTYNVRAFSSMMGETFFAEVTNQDKGGTKGTLTAAEFSHFIGKSLEQMHIRLDTERTFTYQTSRSSVYNLVENDHAHEEYVDDVLQTRQQSQDVIHVINPRDHFFYSKARKRASGKQRLGTVSLRRNAVQKGTLGVRWEKARVNESKLLPILKMEIPNE
ncbi:unnamed protein product [Mytilus coruscus]|uniref:Uncharacterized protein n=1 Tax=Mytilus coruscus TaxID=42192 RepID=A0A6J8A0M9_MYTCO|nr:unnamed protein product [Mytilus coruscus]